MKNSLLPAAFCTAALLFSSLMSTAAEMLPGKMTVQAVQGSVLIVDADGNETLVKKGDQLAQGANVVTGKNSKAVVLLSSGTSVVVNPDSDVEFTKFMQVPYELPAGVQLTELKKAPSISETLITVNEGTLAGRTAKLHEDSSLRIKTPSGTDAVIKGTDYVVTVVIRGGEAFTTITNATGDVVAVSQGNALSVPPGQTVTVEATRTVSASGEVTYTITQVSEPRPATGQEIATSQKAITEIQIAGNTEDTPAEPQGPSSEPAEPQVDEDPQIDVVISPENT